MFNNNDHTQGCINECLSRAVPKMTCPGCSSSYVTRRQDFFTWLQDPKRSQDEIAVVKRILDQRA
jgi:hypothetical protein